MEPFRLVMQQYSRVAAALRSAEMIAAEVRHYIDNRIIYFVDVLVVVVF
jgi:hypothetical protein